MDNRTFLSRTADSALSGMLYEAVRGDARATGLLDQWSDFTVDAINSQYVLTSRALSKDNLVGQYTGQTSFPYKKRSLNVLLPYPLACPLAYPMTFVRFATFMYEAYGITLEEGELTVLGNTQTTPLSGTDLIDATPDPDTGHITFVAAPTSGRFVTDSTLVILPTSSSVQMPLKSLLSLDSALDLHLLTDHP